MTRWSAEISLEQGEQRLMSHREVTMEGGKGATLEQKRGQWESQESLRVA